MSTNQSKNEIQPVRTVKAAPAMTVAGLSITCTTAEEMKNASALWQKLGNE